MLHIGEVLEGRYQVEEKIAQGGMSSVYRAKDLRLRQKNWALKEIPNAPLNKQDFREEVRMLAELSHPYIPKIVDVIEPQDSGYCYIVMELVHGYTLQQLYQEQGQALPLSRVMKVAIQLCEVLQYLHGQPQPIVFRDLKPANVMIDEHDHIRLIDFGIARNYKVGQISDTVSLGTYNFASPEQLECRQTDTRSDLYSLGATLYYLLSGGKHYYASQASISLQSLEVDADLTRLLEQLLQLDPDKRMSSAKVVLDQLTLIQERMRRGSTPSSSDEPLEVLQKQSGLADPTVILRAAAHRGPLIPSSEQYRVQATYSTPALIIYLLDVSGSMSLEMGGQSRIDVVRQALHSALKQMIFRSTKGMRISSRYRIALLAYSDEVHDLLGGIKSIEQFAMTGKLPDLLPMTFTDTAKAFAYAEQLLLQELPHMQDCPAPLICHMTDGAHTGEDPEPIAKRIMEMSVADGQVLVENIFITDSILDAPIENSRVWKGITAETVFRHEVANRLARMSSVLPESYREMMVESSYSLQAGSLMMLPGTSPELVSLGFQMSAATPVLK